MDLLGFVRDQPSQTIVLEGLPRSVRVRHLRDATCAVVQVMQAASIEGALYRDAAHLIALVAVRLAERIRNREQLLLGVHHESIRTLIGQNNLRKSVNSRVYDARGFARTVRR